MSKIQIPRSEYVATNNDITVASKLGYLALRRQYNGQESTPEQVAKIFARAEAVVKAGFITQFVDDKSLVPTQEFYNRARAATNVLPEGKTVDALRCALDDLYGYCGVD